MKKLILSLGEVPQTGRTSFCEILHGLLRQKNVPHLLAHTDVGRPDGLSSSCYLDAGSKLRPEDFIALLDSAPVVVFDMATGETEDLLELYERNDIGEVLAEMDTSVTLALSATRNRQSEATVLRVAEIFRHDADYLILRTHPEESNWLLPNAKRAMHHLGATEVPVPILSDPLVSFLNGSRAALPQFLGRRAGVPRALQPLLGHWEIDYITALEKVSEHLWPTECAQATPMLGSSRSNAAQRNRRIVPMHR
ncbi:MAG: hypothetical protein ACR2OZ_04555 [Verrucomicrobiales bacterium]